MELMDTQMETKTEKAERYIREAQACQDLANGEGDSYWSNEHLRNRAAKLRTVANRLLVEARNDYFS